MKRRGRRRLTCCMDNTVVVAFHRGRSPVEKAVQLLPLVLVLLLLLLPAIGVETFP